MKLNVHSSITCSVITLQTYIKTKKNARNKIILDPNITTNDKLTLILALNSFKPKPSPIKLTNQKSTYTMQLNPLQQGGKIIQLNQAGVQYICSLIFYAKPKLYNITFSVYAVYMCGVCTVYTQFNYLLQAALPYPLIGVCTVYTQFNPLHPPSALPKRKLKSKKGAGGRTFCG